MSEALQPAMPAPATVSNWNLFKDKAANAAHSAAESTKHAFQVVYKSGSDFLRKIYDFFVNVGLPKIASAYRTAKDFAVDHVKGVIGYLSLHREKVLFFALGATVAAVIAFIVQDIFNRRPVVQGLQERPVTPPTAPPATTASVAAASSSVSTTTTVAATSSSSAPSSSSSSPTSAYQPVLNSAPTSGTERKEATG